MFPQIISPSNSSLVDLDVANMESTTGLRRTRRGTRKVDYRISSSSSDDPIQSLQPSRSRNVKRNSPPKTSLEQFSPESLQTQNSSDSDDTPLVPHHLRIALTQKEAVVTYITSRRELEISSCSFPSDAPLFSHLEVNKRKSREHSNSSSESLPSDVPVFPYVRKKLFNAGIFAAVKHSVRPPSVSPFPQRVHSYLRYSEADAFQEDQALEPEISLPEDLAEPGEVQTQALDFVSSNVSVDHELSSPVRIPQPASVTTATLLGSPSININRKGNMAPGYRNRDRDRRQNRTGYVDHDVFEGLPVRHWRRDDVTVAPPSTQENTTSQNDIWAIELPHGMPKDSHLLPQHSQDLLRAARSGRIYKRPAPPEEEEADVEAVLGDKPEKKDDDTKDRGFTAKAWKQIPRHLEGPDIEYLAKRRKGLITIASKPAAPAPTLTKTTVKRIDAAGNEYVQDVVVPHGQKVEGEVISQTVIPDPNAGALDPFAVQPTPPRKKGPTSKKKAKAAGRGRKKKAAAPTSVPAAIPTEGSAPVSEGLNGAVGADGIKIENATEATPANNEDTEMGDGSMAASDDDDGEDGDEGDDGEDDEGSVDNQRSPSKPPRPASPIPIAATSIKTVPNLGLADTPMTGLEFPRHPMIQTERMKVEGLSGSPLKNVALTTSELTSPLESPTVVPHFSDFSTASVPQEPAPTAIETSNLNEDMLLETAESAPTILPPPPPEPTAAEVIASAEVLREEEEEEEMLLDIVDNANNAYIGGPEASIAAPEIPAEQVPISPTEAPAEMIPSEIVELPREAEQEGPALLESAEAEPVPEVQNTEEDDDDFPDLLGRLEKSLEKPEQQAPPPDPTPIVPEISEVDKKAEGVEQQAVAESAAESVDAVEAEKKEEA